MKLTEILQSAAEFLQEQYLIGNVFLKFCAISALSRRRALTDYWEGPHYFFRFLVLAFLDLIYGYCSFALQLD